MFYKYKTVLDLQYESNFSLMRYIILIIFLLINPIVLYVIGYSIFESLIIVILTIILSFYLYNKSKKLFMLEINVLILISIFIYGELIFDTKFNHLKINNLYDQFSNFYWNKSNIYENINSPEYQTIYKTNIQGFRIPVYLSSEYSISKCDWLFLGDSFTQGAQCKYSDLYTSQLVKYFPDKVIVNAGVSGFSIPECFNLFKYLKSKIIPKEVFLQIGSFNDFEVIEEKELDLSSYLMDKSDLARYFIYNNKFTENSKLPLGRWTEPFQVTERANRDYNIFNKNPSNFQKQQFLNLKRYLFKFKNEVEKTGATLNIILFPSKEQVSKLHFDEVIINYKLNVNNYDLRRSNKILKNICDDLDLNLIDVTDYFCKSKTLPFFEIDEHFNKTGHNLAAYEIARQLSKKKKINNEGVILNALYKSCRFPQKDNLDKIWYTSIKRNNSNLYFVKDSYEFDFTNKINTDITHPCLARDTNLICYVQGDEKKRLTKIFISNSNENKSKCITLKNNFGSVPSINNQGNLLIYAGWRYVEKNQCFTSTKLYLYDLKNNRIKDSIGNGKDFIWSPTFIGKNKISYIKKKKNQYEIYTFNLENKIEKRITYTKENESNPIFNFKDSSLIFAKRTNNWSLYKIKNGKTVRLTFSQGDEFDPYIDNKGELYYSSKIGFFEVIQKFNKKLRFKI